MLVPTANGFCFKATVGAKLMIILGPRQGGKATFCEPLLAKLDKKILRLNADDPDSRELLAKPIAIVLPIRVGPHEIEISRA